MTSLWMSYFEEQNYIFKVFHINQSRIITNESIVFPFSIYQEQKSLAILLSLLLSMKWEHLFESSVMAP